MSAPPDAAPRLVSFEWFWSFWHWSTESFRVGASLRNPLQGIGGLWDEWYRHEASGAEQRAIERVGEDVRRQRQFVAWLVRRWGREAQWRRRSPNPRLVLGQLAVLPPFDRWGAMERYRSRYGVEGVFAVILSEGSEGESSDVRRVEAIASAADRTTPFPDVVAEGFSTEASELRAVRDAVQSVLGGRGALRLLALWIVAGRRPYPQGVALLLTAGWVAVVGVLAYLLTVRDPGSHLEPMAALLMVLWIPLTLTGVTLATLVSLRTWRAGARLQAIAAQSELRLRMGDGLTLVGGSAGLPFALNVLSAILRTREGAATRSWLWERVHRTVRHQGTQWAATGIVLPDGAIGPVALMPKVRACLQHATIRSLLTPHQPDGGQAELALSRPALPALPALPARAVRAEERGGGSPRVARGAFGFAAEAHTFRSIRCRHLADAVLAIADMGSRRQFAVNSAAVCASAMVMAAAPDLQNTLFPPPAPMVVETTGSSPFHLAVTLDSRRAGAFVVALESRFWANRRQQLQRAGDVSRANVPLHRLSQRAMWELDDGTLWVERRRGFLFREYGPGERVGVYSLRYLNQLTR